MMELQRVLAFGMLFVLQLAYGQPDAGRGEGKSQESDATDSLRLEILRMAVREAEIDAERTNFWHRLLPRIEFSAGLAAGNLLVADPDAAAGYLMPKDSYRISAGVGLSALFDESPHERSLVALTRRRTELLLAAALQQQARRAAGLLAVWRDTLRRLMEEELALRTEEVRFHELRFRQGTLGFDALVQSRLALLAARRSRLMQAHWIDSEAEEK